VNSIMVSLRDKVAIVGYGETPVSRNRTEKGEAVLNTEQYIAWAADLALKSAHMNYSDLDGQGLAVVRPISPHPVIWGPQVAEDLGITSRFTIVADNGGASGALMLMQASLAIIQGLVDTVLCVGGDAQLTFDQELTSSNIVRSDSATKRTTGLLGLNRDFIRPVGLMGPTSMFAFVQRQHMSKYGTKLEQIGKIAVTQRYHATLNPNAIFKQPITMEDYLNSRLIADPIRLLDCVMPLNGGLAFIVTRADKAKEFTDNPVYMLGYGQCDNYYKGTKGQPDVTYTGFVEASPRAFQMANVKHSDVDLFEPYDDYCIAVVIQLEDVGFCKKGEGGKFVEKTDLKFDGDLPLNTGGGQISAGQPGLPSGMLNLVECIRQLRGEGGKRQVKDPKIGVVTGLGGLQYAKNVASSVTLILGN
jgi:acetyl-CoA acetyltransferase